MTISLIVACAQNLVIGVRNDLPWHIPADLKRFRALTVGKPVIMGRKTFDSIYDRLKNPLPDRPNIVVSRSGFRHDGVEVYVDPETAIHETKIRYSGQEIMVIGGASIYQQSLAFADKIYLTLIDKAYDGDAFFPHTEPEDWKIIAEEDHAGDPSYAFLTLERVR